jgi:hypothetical protein
MPNRKTQFVLFHGTDCRGFIVDGQRDDLDTRCRELFASALKPRELSLAIRTPSPSINQDDTVGSLEGLRNVDRAVANSGNIKSGKALAIFQSRHRQLPKVD